MVTSAANYVIGAEAEIRGVNPGGLQVTTPQILGLVSQGVVGRVVKGSGNIIIPYIVQKYIEYRLYT